MQLKLSSSEYFNEMTDVISVLTGLDPLQWLWNHMRSAVSYCGSEMSQLQILQHSPNKRMMKWNGHRNGDDRNSCTLHGKSPLTQKEGEGKFTFYFSFLSPSFMKDGGVFASSAFWRGCFSFASLISIFFKSVLFIACSCRNFLLIKVSLNNFVFLILCWILFCFYNVTPMSCNLKILSSNEIFFWLSFMPWPNHHVFYLGLACLLCFLNECLNNVFSLKVGIILRKFVDVICWFDRNVLTLPSPSRFFLIPP